MSHTRSRSSSQRTLRRKKTARDQKEREISHIDNLRKTLEQQQRILEDETQKLKRHRKKVLNLGRGLKDSIIDMQRAMNYFRKQTETFINNQNEWIVNQQTKRNGRYAIKYIWADDINKVRLRRQNKGGGMKIWFHDGDSSIFTDIDVWRDVFYNENNNEYHHDELILDIINEIKKQIQKDIKLHNEHLELHQEQKQQNNDEEEDEEFEEDEYEQSSDEDDLLEQLIETLLGEMKHRMNDMSKMDMIFAQSNLKQDENKMETLRDMKDEYVNKIEERHNGLMKYNELELNNASWRELLLQQLPIDIVSVLYNELEDRIEDLKVAKNILLNDESSGNKNKILNDLVNDIKIKRHNVMFNEWDNHKYNNIQSAINENNKRWRNEIMEIISDIYNGMEQKLSDSQQQIDELKRQMDENKNKYNGMDEEVLNSQQQIEELKEQIDENNNKHNIALNELEEQLTEHDTTYKELEIEYENMQKTHQLNTDTMSKQYKTQINKLTKINKLISENLNDSKKSLNTLQNEYENKKQTHKLEMDTLKSEFETEIMKLKEINIALTEEMTNLIKESEEKEAINEIEMKENEFWLFTDTIRNEFIDSIEINSKQEQLIKHIGGYLNRVIPTSDDLQPIALQKLYVPMDENDVKYILNACFDGVLFATLINLMQNDFLDLRALNTPNYNDQKINVLTNEEIKENISIILSSVRALDICQFPAGTNPIDDYFNSKYTLNILLYIVMSLFNGYLNNRINIKTYPELIRLCQNENEKQYSQNISWTQWLEKWLTFMKQETKQQRSTSIDLGNSEQEIINGDLASVEHDEISFQEYENGFEEEEDDIKTQTNTLYNNMTFSRDYHNDIVIVCSKLDKTFDINAVEVIIENNKINNDFTGYQLIMKCIKNKIGIQNKLNITINDIGNHNYLLQQILLSEMFMINNLIKKMTLTEEKNIKKIIKSIKKDDKSMIAWINSFGWNKKLRITNLDGDLSDGIVILKLLDECKNNIVKWRNVRKRSKIRHKFDKLANCKMLMELCQSDFPFVLVGIDGTDIVHQNKKYIKTLLWQIQLYQSTKLINIRYNNNNKNTMITDKDMLLWSNKRIIKYKQNNINNEFIIKNGIKSLKEGSLCDSIYFLNLISSINEKWVNYKLIHKIPSKNEINKNDGNEYKKKRRANARYLITIIRRLGQNIFISVDDICRVEQRAVVSVIASIMTIAAKQQPTSYQSSSDENDEQNQDLHDVD